MNRNFLLPNKWKKWGYILLICHIIAGIYFSINWESLENFGVQHPVWSMDRHVFKDMMNGLIHMSITSHITILHENAVFAIHEISLYLALLIIFFSAGKAEDEFKSKIRLDAMAWAVIVNYGFLILATIGIWGGLFIPIYFASQFLILFIALARFGYLSLRFKYSKFGANSIFEKITRSNRLLLPHSFRKFGWIILGVSVFLHSASLIFPMSINYWVPDFFGHYWALSNNYAGRIIPAIMVSRNILPSALLILTAIGAMCIAFSRETEEDELISQYRLNALSWAIVIHYGILMLLHFVVGGFLYWFAFQYMMFTPLLIFSLRFNYLKYSLRKELCYEK